MMARKMVNVKSRYEYAVQWCTYSIEGQPSWWIATNWYNSPEQAKADFERFLIRNKNEREIYDDLGSRLVRRIVSEIEVVPGYEAGLA